MRSHRRQPGAGPTCRPLPAAWPLRLYGWRQGWVYCVGPHRTWPRRGADAPGEAERIAHWDVLSPMPDDQPALVLHLATAGLLFDRRAVWAAWQLRQRLPAAAGFGAGPPWLAWWTGDPAQDTWRDAEPWPGTVWRAADGSRWLFHPWMAGPWARLEAQGHLEAELADVAVSQAAGTVAVRSPRLALGWWDGRKLHPLPAEHGWVALAPTAGAAP